MVWTFGGLLRIYDIKFLLMLLQRAAPLGHPPSSSGRTFHAGVAVQLYSVVLCCTAVQYREYLGGIKITHYPVGTTVAPSTPNSASRLLHDAIAPPRVA